MKKEDEIFKEWYKLNFKKLPNPREYVYFVGSLDFQCYLLWYRCKELLKELLESIRIDFKKLILKIRKRVDNENEN